MKRRELFRQVGWAAGAAVLWAALPARTWAALAQPAGWTAAEEQFLDLVGDTILPATPDSPGAKAVGIGRFIATMVNDCHEPGVAGTVRRALHEIEAASVAAHGKSFGEISPPQREAILVAYEKTAGTRGKGGGASAFRPIKDLTLLGYFTSETGGTTALRYDPVPGGFRGSVPLKTGDRSWLIP